MTQQDYGVNTKPKTPRPTEAPKPMNSNYKLAMSYVEKINAFFKQDDFEKASGLIDKLLSIDDPSIKEDIQIEIRNLTQKYQKRFGILGMSIGGTPAKKSYSRMGRALLRGEKTIKQKVIEVFFTNEANYTVRHVSEAAEIHYDTASKYLNGLFKQGILERKAMGIGNPGSKWRYFYSLRKNKK